MIEKYFSLKWGFVFWRFQRRSIINLTHVSAMNPLAFDWICFEISPGTRFNVLLRACRLLERGRVCRFNEIAAPDVIRPLPARPLHRGSSGYLLQRSQWNFTGETVTVREEEKKNALCVNYALNSSSLIKTNAESIFRVSRLPVHRMFFPMFSTWNKRCRKRALPRKRYNLSV